MQPLRPVAVSEPGKLVSCERGVVGQNVLDDLAHPLGGDLRAELSHVVALPSAMRSVPSSFTSAAGANTASLLISPQVRCLSVMASLGR